jgi:tRNA threonylcarbamoyladenosine biosynthesis protein TsaE
MRRVTTWTEYTLNPDDTKNLGACLGRYARQGDFIACYGPLGAGKTTFIQGFAEGFKVENAEYVRSPSFALVHEYRGRYPLYHFDFYRLSHWSESLDIGFLDYLDSQGVVIVEWADRFPELLPSDRLDVDMQVLPSGGRSIQFTAYGTTCARFFPFIPCEALTQQ